MLARLNALARGSTYALARRIRRDEFRMRSLEPLKFLHHLVKFDVGDFRLIEHVIEILVPADMLAQPFDLFGGVGALYHSASCIRSGQKFSIQCVSRRRYTSLSGAHILFCGKKKPTRRLRKFAMRS